MHGAFVAETFRQYPPDSLPIIPYSQGRVGVGDYMAAVATVQRLEVAPDDDAAIEVLSQHVFSRHPDVLDLPPAVLHRYLEAKRVAAEHGGEEKLTDSILARFERAEQAMQNGLAFMLTSTVVSCDVARPQPEIHEGQMCQRVLLPDSIVERATIWNQWVQQRIKDREIDTLFSQHPDWHTIKSAEGSLLPAGNLNFEVVEGIVRAYSLLRHQPGAKEELGLTYPKRVWAEGTDSWFAMTHIIERDLLALAASIDPHMIDGMKLTPEVYARAYKPIVELIDLNPQLQIDGVLSEGTWAYSRELGDVFPDQNIARLHDIAGNVLERGPADELGLPEQIMFATYDPVRRAAYEAREYKVGVAARFINRQGMTRVLGRFGIDLAA